MGDWLGTGTIATHLRKYLPFEEARAFARTLGLNSQSEWDAHASSVGLPPDIPKAPHMFYANAGWRSWGDWLGSGRIATYKVQYRPFEQARAFARSLGLKTREAWLSFARSDKRPPDIPVKPERTYAGKGWISMGDWLGTETIAAHLRKFLPFAEARTFARTLGLSSASEWRAHCKSRLLPPDISTNPNRRYRDEGWISWADWLGTTTIATNQRQYRSYREARAFVHSLHLKSANAWRAYTTSGKLPKDIPANPARTYAKKGWTNWGDWLGTDMRSGATRRTFKNASGPEAFKASAIDSDSL
jgi:hypothetical protein